MEKWREGGEGIWKPQKVWTWNIPDKYQAYTFAMNIPGVYQLYSKNMISKLKDVFMNSNAYMQLSLQCCTLQGYIALTGSSCFADDSPLHTDGPEAIPAMEILVLKVVGYLGWAGMKIQLKLEK
jgi:hypothetical protein